MQIIRIDKIVIRLNNIVFLKNILVVRFDPKTNSVIHGQILFYESQVNSLNS